MAKKTTEKDVLIVRDEKTGEISVVAGLNADGSPKRTPAKAENAQSFLQFDRHGDVLDNFFKNFFRQCKEPSRFGFYRVAADQADKLMEVMKDLLKDPEANKELLAPHKVDTSGYEKQVKEEQTAEKTEQTEQKQEEQPKEKQEQEEIQVPVALRRVAASAGGGAKERFPTEIIERCEEFPNKFSKLKITPVRVHPDRGDNLNSDC